MQSFQDFNAGTVVEGTQLELDILGVIKTFNGSADVDIEDDHIVTTVPTMRQVDQILDALPGDLDYEVLVRSIDQDFDDAKIVVSSDGGDEQEDEEYDIDYAEVPEKNVVFDLIIYTYNTVDEEDLQEVKRRIKVNSKGKRRIKMQCKKGFKFDGKKCVKISGSELVNKRRGIRKSVRTKKSKGSGYQKRVARLRNRAMKKRKGMGVRNMRR